MIEVKVPELGESITEVQIAEWLKEAGDVVTVDDPIAEIDSDKATVELPAPVSGKITEIKVASGEFCKVGDVIALIDETVTAPAPEAETPAAAAPTAGAAVMPAAQRVADQAGLDTGKIAGTGPGQPIAPLGRNRCAIRSGESTGALQPQSSQMTIAPPSPSSISISILPCCSRRISGVAPWRWWPWGW